MLVVVKAGNVTAGLKGGHSNRCSARSPRGEKGGGESGAGRVQRGCAEGLGCDAGKLYSYGCSTAVRCRGADVESLMSKQSSLAGLRLNLRLTTRDPREL